MFDLQWNQDFCALEMCVFSSSRWALWFYKNDKSKMWQDNLRLITKFDTVEGFWGWVWSELQVWGRVINLRGQIHFLL